MIRDSDAVPSRHDPPPNNGIRHDEAFPPVSDGDPAANPPLPLDDMPVPPLTEPTDVNGG
jgi:hypothetical protein